MLGGLGAEKTLGGNLPLNRPYQMAKNCRRYMYTTYRLSIAGLQPRVLAHA